MVAAISNQDLEKNTPTHSCESSLDDSEAAIMIPEQGEEKAPGDEPPNDEALARSPMPKQDEDEEIGGKSKTGGLGAHPKDQADVGTDLVDASTLFVPNGGPPALDDERAWSNVLEDQEADMTVLDPDPFGTSKLFSVSGELLLHEGELPPIQIPLPSQIITLFPKGKASKHSVRESSAYYRLHDFISTHDAAEAFNSPEFRSIFAEAKNEKDRSAKLEEHVRVADHSRSRSRSRHRSRSRSDSRETRSSGSDDSSTGTDSSNINLWVNDEYIEIKKKSKSQSQRREEEARTFQAHYASNAQADKAIREVTLSQLLRDQAKIHNIERAQMLKLCRSQHRQVKKLTKMLAKYSNKNELRKDDADSKLHHSQFTKTLTVDKISRFILAVFGGAILMASIITRRFVTTQNMHLVVSSMYIIGLFGVMSFPTNPSRKKVVRGSAT